MKRIHIIITVALIMAIIACCGITGSFKLALFLSGLNADYAEIDSGIDANDRHIKILLVYSEDSPIWAYMQKNTLGIWSVSYTGKGSIGWMKPAGIKRFSATDNPLFETESHVYYYGNDAIMLIDSGKLALPPNTIVNVQQTAKEYWIHITAFVEGDFSVDIRQILLDAGFIS